MIHEWITMAGVWTQMHKWEYFSNYHPILSPRKLSVMNNTGNMKCAVHTARHLPNDWFSDTCLSIHSRVTFMTHEYISKQVSENEYANEHFSPAAFFHCIQPAINMNGTKNTTCTTRISRHPSMNGLVKHVPVNECVKVNDFQPTFQHRVGLQQLLFDEIDLVALSWHSGNILHYHFTGLWKTKISGLSSLTTWAS